MSKRARVSCIALPLPQSLFQGASAAPAETAVSLPGACSRRRVGLFAGCGLGQMPAGCPAPTLRTARATGLSLLEAGAGIYAKLSHTVGTGRRDTAQ